MIQLNLLEKIQTLFEIIKSSSLFIISFVICVSLITLMIMDYKSNKRVNSKLFMASWISTIVFISVKYFKEFLLLSDNLVEEIITAIYFPNLAIYIIMFVSMNILCLYTLIKNKFYIHKISSITATSLIDFLFILIMDIIVKNNINVYEKLTVFSNKELLVLIEITSGIFTIWTIFTFFVRILNKTLNKAYVPVIEENKVVNQVFEKQPNMVPLYSSNNNVFASYEPVKNVTYAISEPVLDGKELFNMFNRGEDLNAEQYKTLKNYLMTK